MHEHPNRLADLRRRAGWTQQQLAERAETSRLTVARIEQGRQEPRVGLATRLARALGETVEHVFDPEGEKRVDRRRVAEEAR
jgi:putative transcriptional regulator